MGRRILVVEDERNWALTYESLFEEYGTVIIAAGVKEAIKVILEEGADVVITDGLEGEWPQVTDAAQRVGIQKITLVTGDDDHQQVAEQKGIRLVNKLSISKGDVQPEDLI